MFNEFVGNDEKIEKQVQKNILDQLDQTLDCFEVPMELSGDKIDMIQKLDRPLYWEDDLDNIIMYAETNGESDIGTVKYSLDDNGNPYKTNEGLLPSNTYEINGYTYCTDELGRIISVKGDLHLTERENRMPLNENMDKIGQGDERESDHRGHLIGDQFDGSNKLENLVPMDAKLNQGGFKNFEKELADALKDGKKVYIEIDVYYDDDSHRPSHFVASYSLDGEEQTPKIFENGGQED